MKDSESIVIELLLEAIFRKYGYYYLNYSRASLKRRVNNVLTTSKLNNFSEIQHKILYDKKFFETVLLDLTINVTEMFRDPSFYCAVREKVIPVLKTYPFIKVWHAGCATGEEVYSMAILLKEENLLSKTMLYATDIDDKVLRIAREGIYPLDRIKEYTQNYQKAKGSSSFSDYYTAKYQAAIMDSSLKKHIAETGCNVDSFKIVNWIFFTVNSYLCWISDVAIPITNINESCCTESYGIKSPSIIINPLIPSKRISYC